jgi:hypothetical protein
LKRRETKSVQKDAGRAAFVSAGSRWLSFARMLARGQRRLAAADTLAFVESLYGGKFKAVEGGAFSLDKVYRTNGGGLFVSETRLNVSVHPRFDLRVLNVAGTHAVTQLFTGSPPPTSLTPLLQTSGRDREQQLEVRHVTHVGLNAPLLTVNTWNVSQPGAERVLPVFGYVNVHGQRAQQTQGLEAARPPARGDVTTGTVTETQWPTVAAAPASLRLTSLDPRLHIVNVSRQEFVNVLLNTYLPVLNTYLPVVESREILSARTTGDSSGSPQRRATTQGETERRFVLVPGTSEPQPPALTYAEPAPRHAPGSAVEIRTEVHSTETVKAYASAPHAPARDSRQPLLQVLPPTSLLLSLSETSLTLLAGGVGRTAYDLGGRAPALSLQHTRTHTAQSGTREVATTVYATRLFKQTPQSVSTDTREVHSSLNALVERVHSTFHVITSAAHSTVFTQPSRIPKPAALAGIKFAAHSTVFTRPVFEPVLRRTFEQVSARQRGAASEAKLGDAASPGLFGQTVEFARPTSAVVFTREVSTHDAGTQIQSDGAGVFSTQGAPGAGTFLFASGLLRRTKGASTAGALSPTVATFLRLSTATFPGLSAVTFLRQPAAAETERAVSETRAARPEGMALELIRHRREEVLQLPTPGYVFTQPARAQLEERQVITKASREEIVEVVRKEVRTLAAAAPATAAASHADLAGLADEVYSTLVRRLLVERERLGRF